jgi:hypothetical protein
LPVNLFIPSTLLFSHIREIGGKESLPPIFSLKSDCQG